MAHYPVPDPEPPEPISSSRSRLNETAPWTSAADTLNFESELSDLTAKFSSEQGGNLSAELSAELALEVILNEIVEQACQVTGASGAAVILERDGEWVCRASGGASAPELGARLSSESGLTAACVRTQEVQRCIDAENDPRADLLACRSLGVRSVIMLPIVQDGSLMAVFAAFSPRASAFGEQEESTLRTLSGYLLSTLVQASAPGPVPMLNVIASADKNSSADNLGAEAEAGKSDAYFVAGKTVETDFAEQATQGSFNDRGWSLLPSEADEGELHSADAIASNNLGINNLGVTLVTWILGAAVFAFAVLLTTIAVRRFTGKKQTVGGQASHAVAITSGVDKDSERATMASAQKANGESAASESVAGESATSDSYDFAGSTAQAVSGRGDAREGDSTQPGSLTVYENGKVVFHMPPTTQQPTATPPTKTGESTVRIPASAIKQDESYQVSSLATKNVVIHRVQPVYPEAALQQKIQGAVLLDVRAGRDGTMQEVTVISGPPLLADAAVAAVKQWQFKPSLVKGHPVETETRVVLNFTLPH